MSSTGDGNGSRTQRSKGPKKTDKTVAPEALPVPPSKELTDHIARLPSTSSPNRALQAFKRPAGRGAWQQQALARCQLLRAQWVLLDEEATQAERVARADVSHEFLALL